MSYNKIKMDIFRIISPKSRHYLPAKIYEIFVMLLVAINVFTVILETFSGVSIRYRFVLGIVEIISIAVFSVEYILRIWTADLLFPKMRKTKARLRYLFSFMGIIDLLAVIPFFVPYMMYVDYTFLRTLKLARIIRMFKANRYIKALSVIGMVLRSKAAELISSFGVILMLMLVSSVLMYSIENEAQPEVFENAFAGIWWAIATFTTVGYGDIFPVTVMGKVLNSIMAILGIGLVAVPTGIISAGFVEHMEEEKCINEKKKAYCPYCGEKLE